MCAKLDMDSDELYSWMLALLRDAEEKLKVSEATKAYVLLNRGTKFLRRGAEVTEPDEFVCWVEETVRDAKKKLRVSNKEIADVLLRLGLQSYLRTVANLSAEDV